MNHSFRREKSGMRLMFFYFFLLDGFHHSRANPLPDEDMSRKMSVGVTASSLDDLQPNVSTNFVNLDPEEWNESAFATPSSGSKIKLTKKVKLKKRNLKKCNHTKKRRKNTNKSQRSTWIRMPSGECPKAKDGQSQFFCPTPDKRTGGWTCFDDYQLCNGVRDCPNGDEENPLICSLYQVVNMNQNLLAKGLSDIISLLNNQKLKI